MTPTKKHTLGQDADTIQDAIAAAAKQSDGLDLIQLVSKDADGKPKYTRFEFLNHMIKHQNIH